MNNILLIVADQFRYDCQGYVNKAPVITPNIDSLASEGFSFDNAYTSIPTCCPARQSFYACKRSESFGSYWNYNITMPIGGLPVEEYSFMRDFHEAGYETIHLGAPELNPSHGPEEYGYNKHRNFWKEFKETPYSGPRSWEGWIEECEPDKTPTGFAASCVMEELEKLKDGEKPFFVTACFTSPHPPYRPHKMYHDLYAEAVKWGGFEDDFTNKPYIHRQMVANWHNEDKGWDYWEPIVRKYYGQVTELDANIGRILDGLKEIGAYDDTTVIFTADHGDMCGDHKMYDKHCVLYEDIVHVPLVIKPAKGLIGEFVPGRVTKEYTVHNLDLGPTLMELSGITPSCDALHGLSFLSVLKGGKSQRSEAVSTSNGSQFGLNTQRCIKMGKWKYIWSPTDTDELYDLESDPWEMNNIIHAEEYRQVLASLRKRLLEILLREGDPFCTIGRGWAARIHLEENNKI